MSVQKEVTVIKTENEYVKVGDTFIVKMSNHKDGTGVMGANLKVKI
ncbi:MAG: hypothetical protein LBH55_03730 [Mycoplasmataceae bacterium]|jgi:hypothetical protein|nr:hypothetical protein [Mycoplasmataceae bacterium]